MYKAQLLLHMQNTIIHLLQNKKIAKSWMKKEFVQAWIIGLAQVSKHTKGGYPNQTMKLSYSCIISNKTNYTNQDSNL